MSRRGADIHAAPMPQAIPLLGVGIASAVFGVALVVSGMSSSVTGTLAGQIGRQRSAGKRTAPATYACRKSAVRCASARTPGSSPFSST